MAILNIWSNLTQSESPLAMVNNNGRELLLSLCTQPFRVHKTSFVQFRCQGLFKPNHTLRQLFPSPKDKPEKMESSGIVNNIPCKDCPSCYIGQTGRKLKKRLDEQYNQPILRTVQHWLKMPWQRATVWIGTMSVSLPGRVIVFPELLQNQPSYALHVRGTLNRDVDCGALELLHLLAPPMYCTHSAPPLNFYFVL